VRLKGVSARLTARTAAAVLAVVAILLQTTKEVLGEFGPPTWLNLTLIAVGLVLVALTYLVGRAQRRGERNQALGRLLREWPLRRAGDSRADRLGAFSSAIGNRHRGPAGDRAPYVERDVDEALRKAVTTKPAIVVTGPPASGKSRSAFEAVRRELPDALVVAPVQGAALRKLEELEPPLRETIAKPAIVWLDDLQDFVRAGLTEKDVAGWARHEPRVVVVATLRGDEAGLLLATPGEVGRSMRSILESTHQVQLQGQASATERARFAELYPGEELVGGIGETLVAGRRLIEKLRYEGPSCPPGVALVQAAIDWRRAGLTRPIPVANLQQLFHEYLHALSPAMGDDEEALETGLKWARSPVESSAALLMPAPSGAREGYTTLDYVVAAEEGTEADGVYRAIPPHMWVHVVKAATPEEALAVGISSLSRREFQPAESALEKAATASEKTAQQARLGLAAVAVEVGDAARAEQLLRESIEGGPDEAAISFTLADVRAKAGDMEGSREALAQAVQQIRLRGKEKRDVQSAFMLGVALKRQDKTEEATEAFREAAALARAEFADGRQGSGLMAAVALTEAGDEDEAVTLLREVFNAGGSMEAMQAAITIGPLLEKRGDSDEAQTYYERAAALGEERLRSSESPLETATSALVLAEVRRAGGDGDGAAEAYRLAARSDPRLASNARERLATLDAELGSQH
jgi:tetratricopeptide (TPR) repeat protein